MINLGNETLIPMDSFTASFLKKREYFIKKIHNLYIKIIYLSYLDVTNQRHQFW
jgi:hypothetical protein